VLASSCARERPAVKKKIKARSEKPDRRAGYKETSQQSAGHKGAIVATFWRSEAERGRTYLCEGVFSIDKYFVV
jgi:hypothetical protein